MACSDCYPGNTTVIRGGDGIQVSGNGTPDQPFIITRFDNPEGDWQQVFFISSTPDLMLDVVGRPSVVETTLNGAGDLVLPSWTASNGGILTLVLNQDATGSRTLDFVGAGVLASAPIVLSTAPGAKDVVRLLWTGFDWIATEVILDVS